MKGTITIVDVSSQQRKVTTSSTGRFAVELRPGRYVVTGRSPEIEDGIADCSDVVHAVITRDNTTNVEVTCPVR
jgi:hypothetical protein